MKRILGYIQKRSDEHRDHPFIKWIDDESVALKDRLSLWYPYSSFFIMSFNDLSRMIFPYPESESATDKRKALITEHCQADATHRELYFKDLQSLGLDREMKFSEFLRFLWGEEERDSRLFVYRICELTARCDDPLLRYSLLACIEFHVQVLFGKLLELSRRYREETGTTLYFMGERHLDDEVACVYDLEHGKAEDVRIFMDEVLDDETLRKAFEAAEYMCDQIALSRTNMLEFAKKHQKTMN
jgi:hypothetical protein